MTTTTTETVTINGTVLQLDALVQGYAEVLEQAKSQLERFEISEHDWARLSYQLEKRVDYQRLGRQISSDMLAVSSMRRMGDPLSIEQQELDGLMQRIVDAITSRFEKQIELAVKAQVRELTSELRADILELARSEARAEIELTDRNDGTQARERQALLRDLLRSMLGHDMAALARTAARELNEELEQARANQ